LLWDFVFPLTLLPQDPIILYHLGAGYYKNNNPKESKNALQAALNISKNFRGADQAAEILKRIEIAFMKKPIGFQLMGFWFAR
jgi:hypothetical protein